MINKKSQIHFSLLDIVFGLIMIAGGIAVVFSKTNFGLALTSIGAAFEAIKIVIERGM